MSLTEAQKYLKSRLHEISQVGSGQKNPWPFVMCAAFIDYMKVLSGSPSYSSFICSYLPARYKNFSYTDLRKKDLPKQMYHILRCGIVHSFSLFPDDIGTKRGARPRAVTISHRSSRNKHLDYKVWQRDGQTYYSAVFVLEDFIKDISSALDKLFRTAKRDKKLRNRIQTQLKKQPLIGWHTKV